MTHQAFRYALDVNDRQRGLLASHAGAARYAWNWGLRRIVDTMAAHRAGEATTCLPSAMSLHRDWNSWKKSEAGIAWWTEVSKCAPQEAFRDLEAAMRAFWDSRGGRRAGPRVHFPRFKKKGRTRDRFRLTGAIHVETGHVRLPRLGRLRLHEAAKPLLDRLQGGSGHITAATVSREADRWYVSLAVEVDRTVPVSNGYRDTVGVDLGVLALATLSTGEVVAGPRALRAGLRRLRRLSRRHSRCQKGSANRRRVTRRLARHHARVAAVRRDHLHKLTTMLAKSHGRIVVEDLNVRGMLGNRQLARSLSDAGFGELRRMLDYKCRWYGAQLVVASRWFPSSKACSACGAIRTDLSLGERSFRCPGCGLVLDRDLNAAINLAGWAHPAVAASASETENACPRGGQTAPGAARPDDAGTEPQRASSPGPRKTWTLHKGVMPKGGEVHGKET